MSEQLDRIGAMILEMRTELRRSERLAATYTRSDLEAVARLTVAEARECLAGEKCAYCGRLAAEVVTRYLEREK